MAEVIDLNGKKRELAPAIEPDIVLEAAKGKLSDVLVLGYEVGEDGEYYYAANFDMTKERALFLIEFFKQRYLFR